MIGKIIARVRKEMTGRLAYEKHNIDYLLEAAIADPDWMLHLRAGVTCVVRRIA